MRLFGALLIFFASGYAGILMARTFLDRPRNLRAFHVAIQALETEINYTRTSLPEACLHIAIQSKPPISLFFQVFVEKLKCGEGISSKEAWDTALVILIDGGFSKDDIEKIATLGNILGRSDADDQRKHLALLQRQLVVTIDEAEADKEKNARLWNYIGFCIGALVVVLLY